MEQNKPTYWSPDEQDRFESYLMDQMNTSERAEFEKELHSDPGLEARYIEFRACFRAVEEDALRAKMDGFHLELEETTEASSPGSDSRRFYLGLAASLVLLLGLALTWYYTTAPTNQQLFREYYTPDPGLPTVMGNQQEYEFYRAMVAYKQGDYEAALQTWKKLEAGRSDSDTLNYFIGSAYLSLGEEENSLSYFDKVIQAPPETFRNEANYYKGMALLKLGRTEEAIRYLEESSLDKGKDLLEVLRE